MDIKPQHIQEQLDTLPDKPGCYQYFDTDGNLIYIGKAKNLKKRVTSYFNKDTNQSGKTMVMVRRIADIKFIITETELDALLLENNLIKKHQPRYNVLLKDDKTYPWILIKNESFPRVFYTRRLIRDGSQYFGPFANVNMIRTLLEMIHSIYKIRTCSLNLSKQNVEARKFKVCLEYHIKNCLGPCEAHQTEEHYQSNVEEIKQILKGNITQVLQHLRQSMKNLAEQYEYEKAQMLKEKIDLLELYRSKSVVVSPVINNVDVFTIASESSDAFVNYMKVINGAVVQAQTIELKRKLDESDSLLLAMAIAEFRQRYESSTSEIITNLMPDVELDGVEVVVPQRGEKKHLIELSLKNARYSMIEKLNQYDKLNPEHKTERLLNKMQTDLRLKQQPKHIECFDNSNLQGTNAVAAMSVFKNGKPSKQDYRHFNIKTVTGPDDFASMEEVIFRRYSRLLAENEPLPDLIIIDGGKGQLSAAVNSLQKLNLYGKIPVIGIAKKLEELYYPEDSVPLYLDKKSETLKVIQHLRDEVHRFGITHHRNKRSKNFIRSELDSIQGIGHSSREALLQHFRSVSKIKLATEEELASVIGPAKAKIIFSSFNS